MLAPPSRHHRLRTLILFALAALTVATCAGLLGAAALMPAPPAALPFVAAVCVGGPMLVGWDLRAKLSAMRRLPRPLDSDALTALREHLDSLPETPHPLGL